MNNSYFAKWCVACSVSCLALMGSAFGADTEMTKIYKSLPAIESQMVRAVMGAMSLYDASVDYGTLDNDVMSKVAGTDFGSISDLREKDM